MRLTRSRFRWLLLGIVVIGVSVAATIWFWPANPDVPDAFPLTPLSASPYLNTGADARYVGSESCRACHEDRHATFRHTGMGRSMAQIDLTEEPPDGSFEHALSKRRYEVRRRDGQMWHRELLLASGPEILLAEYPMKYVVGSGRHSRTYLAEVDEFMVESPATWYSEKNAWGISPGYDGPHQPGFERPAGDGCLTCHAGRAEAIGTTMHKMRVAEPAISCERCHGPGSLHVEKHAGRAALAAPRTEADLTIVNPSRLSRELAEAVCQQCHLSSTAMVEARGRKPSDFRPGLPLSDFLHAYTLESPDEKMTVVGHVEQMHLSRCYQSSATLTCLTCHSPHSEPASEAKMAYYQAACQQCHKPERCKVEPERRKRESPANDCVYCHMPRAPTEIPHLAFTHHRIGIHAQGVAPDHGSGNPDAELKPFLDLSRYSKADQRRSLGLAYLTAAGTEKDPKQAVRFRNRALDFLSAMHETGLRDGKLEAGLARVRFELELGRTAPHAQLALGQPDLNGTARSESLFLLADELARQGNAREAAAAFHDLTKIRRASVDWVLLAECERSLGNRAAADESLQNAVRINPRLWKVHEELAEKFRRQGDESRAEYHRKRAVP